MKLKHSIILLLLILLCLAVRLFNFVGIGTNDDICYIDSARILAAGNSPYTCQIGFRSGMVGPIAILFKVFGLNEIAFIAYPLVCSLITCALIYLTAIRLWGIGTAVFAALLWIAYPLQIVFDTQLSPSNQHATCVAASLFFYSLAAKPVSSSKWGGPVFLMLSGVFLGFAWLVNEIFVTFILIILPFIIIVRPKIKHLILIAAGFAVIFLSEIILIKIVTGSWFMRFTCILNTESIITSNKDSGYLPRTLFKIFNANPLYEEGHFGIIWYLFIVGLAIFNGEFSRRRAHLLRGIFAISQ
jgi:4-amino-4-deoxy-L-arabinose transferase-like glycosyltransferase